MKTRAFGRLLALALVAVLAGCSKLTLEPAAGAATGSLMVEVATAAAARTIAPAPLTAAELANAGSYKLMLSARNQFQTLPEREVSLDAAGTATVPGIPDGRWDLTLTAYDAAGTMALLSGHATVTVRGPGARARFTLTPRGGTGTGTLRVTLSYSASDLAVLQSDTSKSRHCRVALYRKGTDTMVAGTEAAWNRNAGLADSLPTSLTYAGGSSGTGTYHIAAGEYELRLRIWGGGLPAGVTLEWRDNLYIEPGRQTTATVTVPRLSGTTAAPTGFTAAATTAAASGGGLYAYTGTLSWDAVYNMDHYELELLEFAAGTARPASDTAWTAAAAAAGSVVSRYSAVPGDPDNYGKVDGSRPGMTAGHLLADSTGVSLALALASGRSYTARLRCWNAFGSSAWVYLAAPLVPAPVAPSSLAAEVSSIDIAAGAATTFPVRLDWAGGFVDAEGTWELQVLAFTSGALATNDTAWNTATGTKTTLTAAAPVSGPASVAAGGLGPGSHSATLTLADTSSYYIARLRGKGSGGAATSWVYLQAAMIPMPAIVNHNSTQCNRWTTLAGTTTRVQVWDADMTIWGPQCGTNMRMEWIKLAVAAQDGPVLDDATWAYLYTLSLNSGSNGKSVSIRGAGTNRMPDMNKDMAFVFRIRLNTPYGNSPWYYYPAEVEQAP